MKKTLLLLSVSALTLTNAQTVSISDTLSTSDKTTYFEAVTTAPSLDNITGANSVWDYSTLQPLNANTAINDTVIHAANSVYAADYPAANYQEKFDAGVQVFFSNTATEMISHGFAFELDGTPATLKYNDNQFISAQYPMTTATDYTDAIEGELNTTYLTQAIDVDLIGTATVKVDGSGKLKVSNQVFENVIRVKTVEILDGTVPPIPPIFAGSDVTVTRTSYSYYLTTTSKFPIFMHGVINADFTSTIPSSSVINVWSSVELGLVGIDNNEITALSIFPNPSTNNVTITTVDAKEISIFNAVGELVYSNVNPSNTETINVSEFAKGMYIIKVNTNGTISTEKLIVE